MSPFDFQTENEAIKRRQAIAQAMMMQGLQQQGGTEFAPGGFAVKRSPLEGIAKMAQTYFGAKGIKGGDDELKALKEQERARVAEAMDSYTQATTPQPEIPMPSDEIGGGPGLPARNPSAEDKRAAAMKLMGSVGDPRDAAKLLVADAMKTPEVKAYKPGDVLYKDGKQVGSIPDRPEKPVAAPSAVREYEFAKTQGYKGTFEQWQTNQRRAGATRVNVNPSSRQETEEAKTVGKGFGEQYIDLQRGGMSAQSKLNNLSRMEQLMQGVQTGALVPTAAQVASVGETLGIKIDPKLGDKQAIESLSNEMALQLRNPSGGAGMPGAMSDKDREFLANMTPGLAKTPEGNALMIDTAKKLAQRDIQVAAKAREYRQRRGQLDEGFYNELATWSAENPMFKQAPAPLPAKDRRATPREPSRRVVVDY